MNQRYWMIDSGGLPDYAIYMDDVIDRQYLSFGNCFRTRKDAVKMRDKIKELLGKI